MGESDLCADTINLVPLSKKKKREDKNRLKITEIMLILSAVGIVVFLALLAINPSKEAAQARNLKRSADISTILTYISSYVSANESVPSDIPNSDSCVKFTHEICKSGPYDCTDLVNMGFLTSQNQEQLVIIPSDPLYVSVNGTGYYVSQDGQGVVTVCAPHAERNEQISFSKYMY